jgi:carbon-monoxide dehydrogenase small subunit
MRQRSSRRRVMEANQEKITIRFTVNQKDVELDVESDETALFTIRERLGLKGAKEGCGIGECGACTILVDGKAVNSCLMLAAQLHDRKVLTVEGLEVFHGLHPIQQAFLEHHAVQCGFCTPGLLMSALALLERNPRPSREEILEGVAGNLCRCTGYEQIVAAIEDAAERLFPGPKA